MTSNPPESASPPSLPLRFEAPLLQPRDAGESPGWAFVILPKAISATFARRGRTGVHCVIGGHAFEVVLEPDGQLSHWLRVPAEVVQACAAKAGATIAVEITPLASEPEPVLPADFDAALAACPEARAVWHDTTTIARIDWIHWVESAKQARTRSKRIRDACDMLASGKRRVCCFDPSGFYSKALSAPRAV